MKRRASVWLPSLALLATLAFTVFPAGPSPAQTGYPNKPVRIVSDSPVGSANDVTARIVADKLGKIWGQQVIIVNQPGAGGGISARVAASAARRRLYLLHRRRFGVPGAARRDRVLRRTCRPRCRAILP